MPATMPDVPVEPPEAPASASPLPAAAIEPGLVLWLHRALTLGAVMGLVVGLRGFWNGHALTRPGLAFALSCAYLVMLIAAILALCLRGGRALSRLDVGVLGTAIAIKLIGAWPALIGERIINVDEGTLMDNAARTLAAGHNPYLAHWTSAGPGLPTQLMNGGTALEFGYPPFGAELGAVVQRILPDAAGIVVLAWLALIATTVLIFRAAPVPLRPIATLGMLGLGTLTSYANNAYPSMIALPFLCLAAWRWTSIGRDGRLGRTGIVRAVALGLACATHQLGWFLALFLIVGLAVLRRGELPPRTTAAVLIRYVGIALGVFLLVSAPFLVVSPTAWLTGMFEPLLQHAVPHGQGIMSLSYYVIGGSGGLDFYGYASTLLLAAMLIAHAVHLRTIGPAAVVLPWLVFIVSTRSQDGYWVLTMPLWIVALCSTSRDDFAGAYRFHLPQRLAAAMPARGGQTADTAATAARTAGTAARTAGAAATAALFLPTLACVVIAAASPQPLGLRVTTPIGPGQTIRAITVQVTNRSGRPITPHFAVTTDVDIAEYWKITTGPATLPPQGTAAYILSPQEKTWKAPAKTPAFLRAVSDRPQTLSSERLLP
jgi:hypothetical protein